MRVRQRVFSKASGKDTIVYTSRPQGTFCVDCVVVSGNRHGILESHLPLIVEADVDTR